MVLRGEAERAEIPLQLIEFGAAQAFGMKEIAMLAIVPARLADLYALIPLCDRRKVQVFPSAILEQDAGEIIDMKTLHDEDDGALATDCRSATSASCEPTRRIWCGRSRNVPRRLSGDRR